MIVLAAGATFTGNFVLPVKEGAQFITVRSSTPDAKLPADGRRITPAYAPLLAKIQSPNSAPAVKTAPGAHHWRLILLEFPYTNLRPEARRRGERTRAHRAQLIDHNTIDHDGSAVVYAYGGTATAPKQVQGFQFTNNAARHNAYGINGANFAFGNGVIGA